LTVFDEHIFIRTANQNITGAIPLGKITGAIGEDRCHTLYGWERAELNPTFQAQGVTVDLYDGPAMALVGHIIDTSTRRWNITTAGTRPDAATVDTGRNTTAGTTITATTIRTTFLSLALWFADRRLTLSRVGADLVVVTRPATSTTAIRTTIGVITLGFAFGATFHREFRWPLALVVT